tara:strand:+ start:972 stop:1244 length:273 start_codon:yes stop_codon:yes gene_type:complete
MFQPELRKEIEENRIPISYWTGDVALDVGQNINAISNSVMAHSTVIRSTVCRLIDYMTQSSFLFLRGYSMCQPLYPCNKIRWEGMKIIYK